MTVDGVKIFEFCQECIADVSVISKIKILVNIIKIDAKIIWA